MQRSSETIGAIAAALAKAQIELQNPEKSLTATIRSPLSREADRSFRYASLSSGLDLVRNSLGRQEIATVQTTSIDEAAGLIRLTTTLAHSSGEWVSSDWPVCPVSETSAPQRMGAALTYARRYALFTLVGIAGEDDLDAPDLHDGLDGSLRPAVRSDEPGPHAGPDGPPPAISGFPALPPKPTLGGRRPDRLPRVILAPEQSQMRREKLIIELAAFTDTEALTVWAARILPQKNQLVTSDAVRLEDAFAAKLSQLERDRATEDRNAGIGKDAEPANSESSGSAPAAAALQHTRSRELNGHRSLSRAPTGKNGSAKGVRLENVAEQSVTPIGKTLRMRDRDHLKFVTAQPCLVCGRSPSDAHHLKYAQGRALSRKVSDEFAVPLCRTHHRELHRHGDERVWWRQISIDPLLTALALWGQTHPALAKPNVEAVLEEKCARAGVSKGDAFYETKPMAADTP